MTNWLIERHRTVLAVTIGISLVGYGLFFPFAEISFDLPILMPLIAVTAILSYLFGFGCPFIGAAIIEFNRRFVGASLLKPVALARLFLWFALIGLLIAIVGIAAGDAESALGVSGVCGLLAGSCLYLSRIKLIE